MDKKEAFEIVLNEMKNISLFMGKYDAQHGSDKYMHGISTVMEYIAYNISDEVGDEFSDTFLNNLIASEEYAKELRHAPSYLAGEGRRK